MWPEGRGSGDREPSRARLQLGSPFSALLKKLRYYSRSYPELDSGIFCLRDTLAVLDYCGRLKTSLGIFRSFPISNLDSYKSL